MACSQADISVNSGAPSEYSFNEQLSEITINFADYFLLHESDCQISTFQASLNSTTAYTIVAGPTSATISRVSNGTATLTLEAESGLGFRYSTSIQLLEIIVEEQAEPEEVSTPDTDVTEVEQEEPS